MTTRSLLAILAWFWLAPVLAGAQNTDLPPGVLLLSKIRHQVQAELEHLPSCTCLETVERSRSAGRPGARLEPVDTLRLEVLYNGDRELYASPGARVFGDEGPASFVAGGMIGDGVFATHLYSIFVSNSAIFTYRGEDTVARDRGWARAVKYDFHISRFDSGWKIVLPSASSVVGEQGSVWADPETFDLLRVEIHAAGIPEDLPIRAASIISTYGRMRIGTQDIMLPQSAEMRLIDAGGKESVDRFDFTHCHSYEAESSISFGATPETAANAPAEARNRLPTAPASTLPPGLSLPITLLTALNSNSTVGALVEGRISANINLKGKTVIPQGAVVHGRLREFQRHAEGGGYFVVAIEFTDVQAGGTAWRFYADLEGGAYVSGLEWLTARYSTHKLSSDGPSRSETAPYNTQTLPNEDASRSETVTIQLPDLPGVGSFLARGRSFALPSGVRTEWKTRALK